MALDSIMELKTVGPVILDKSDAFLCKQHNAYLLAVMWSAVSCVGYKGSAQECQSAC